MAIVSTGNPITFGETGSDDIRSELGEESAALGLAEYYGATVDLPSIGAALSFSDFYGVEELKIAVVYGQTDPTLELEASDPGREENTEIIPLSLTKAISDFNFSQSGYEEDTSNFFPVYSDGTVTYYADGFTGTENLYTRDFPRLNYTSEVEVTTRNLGFFGYQNTNEFIFVTYKKYHAWDSLAGPIAPVSAGYNFSSNGEGKQTLITDGGPTYSNLTPIPHGSVVYTELGIDYITYINSSKLTWGPYWRPPNYSSGSHWKYYNIKYLTDSPGSPSVNNVNLKFLYNETAPTFEVDEEIKFYKYSSPNYNEDLYFYIPRTADITTFGYKIGELKPLKKETNRYANGVHYQQSSPVANQTTRPLRVWSQADPYTYPEARNIYISDPTDPRYLITEGILHGIASYGLTYRRITDHEFGNDTNTYNFIRDGEILFKVFEGALYLASSTEDSILPDDIQAVEEYTNPLTVTHNHKLWLYEPVLVENALNAISVTPAYTYDNARKFKYRKNTASVPDSYLLTTDWPLSKSYSADWKPTGSAAISQYFMERMQINNGLYQVRSRETFSAENVSGVDLATLPGRNTPVQLTFTIAAGKAAEFGYTHFFRLYRANAANANTLLSYFISPQITANKPTIASSSVAANETTVDFTLGNLDATQTYRLRWQAYQDCVIDVTNVDAAASGFSEEFLGNAIPATIRLSGGDSTSYSELKQGVDLMLEVKISTNPITFATVRCHEFFRKGTTKIADTTCDFLDGFLTSESII